MVAEPLFLTKTTAEAKMPQLEAAVNMLGAHIKPHWGPVGRGCCFLCYSVSLSLSAPFCSCCYGTVDIASAPFFKDKR